MHKINKHQFLLMMGYVRNNLAESKSLRLGQAIFNEFSETFEIAEAQRGTDNDPFYNNQKLIPFMEAVLDEEALQYWNQSNIYQALQREG